MPNDELFGRQPLPVEVTITGADSRDVEYWARELTRRAESAGDLTQLHRCKHAYPVASHAYLL